MRHLRILLLFLGIFLIFLITSDHVYAANVSPSYTQTHFRFRNDDGSQTTATWKVAVDTAITGVSVTSPLRLRISTQETAGASGGSNTNYQARFEYSTNATACNNGTWTQLATSTTAWIISDSANITNGGATTQQISSGTFLAGSINDTAQPVTISGFSSKHTEHEVSIVGNNPGYSTTYRFRLTRAGTAFNTYSQCAILTTEAAPVVPDITTGLVGWWKLNDAGTTATDSSGNGNDGALMNSPTWTAGHAGSAVSYEANSAPGTNQYISVADDPTLDLATFSVGGWINITSYQPNWTPLFTKEDSSGTARNYGVYLSGGSGILYYSMLLNSCSTWASNYSSQSLATGGWNHVMFTYDGTTLKFYINGALDSSLVSAGTPCQSATLFRIGEPDTTYYPFIGKIDDVRIYSRALSSDDISLLYAYTEVPDTTDPTATLTAPLSGATISANVNMTADATDDNGVTAVSFKVDGATVGSDSTSPYSYNWDTTTVTNGTHSLVAVARDAIGNTASSTAVSVTVSNSSTGDITNGLTAWYKLDETFGTVVSDSSGNNLDGTLYNAAGTVWGTGQVDRAITLDGINDYIEIPSAAVGSWDDGSDRSFAAWFKTTAQGVILGQTDGTAPSGGPGGYVPSFYIDDSNTLRGEMFWHALVSQNTAPSALNDGAWHHIANVYESGIEKLYIDGTLVDSQTVSQTNYSGVYSYFLGTGYGTGWTGFSQLWWYLNGSLDDVRFYGRAITPTEVAELFAYAGDGSPGDRIPSGPPNGTGEALHGFAWSENFGWISFNSDDTGMGGGQPYSVNIDNTTGDWTGFAWSENLGWISFYEADAIDAGCSASPQVTMDMTTGHVTGYAYAMVYGTSIDGCIQMSDTDKFPPDSTGIGGVTFDSATNQFVGYAWGGDNAEETGTGWISFDTTAAVSGCTDCVVSCPTCAVSGAITGTCTTPVTEFTYDPNGYDITWTATGNGTAPHTYAWNPSGSPPYTYTGTNTFQQNCVTSCIAPNVVIKDANGDDTGLIACSSVNISGAPVANYVHVGKTVATADKESYVVREGQPFALSWYISLADSYVCDAGILGPGMTPISSSLLPENWNTNWPNNFTSPEVVGTTRVWSGNTGTLLTSEGALPRVYDFFVKCSDMNLVGPTYNIHTGVKVNVSSGLEM